MKRKLILAGIFGLLIQGCDSAPKQVTREMLEGAWDCSPSIQEVGIFNYELGTLVYQQDKSSRYHRDDFLGKVFYEKIENEPYLNLKMVSYHKNGKVQFANKIQFNPIFETETFALNRLMHFYQEYQYVDANHFNLKVDQDILEMDEMGKNPIDGTGSHQLIRCVRDNLSR